MCTFEAAVPLLADPEPAELAGPLEPQAARAAASAAAPIPAAVLVRLVPAWPACAGDDE
ncbi:MAG TPA: hypothetical protein VGM79_02630 [Streptosporangiaceae bacterium]